MKMKAYTVCARAQASIFMVFWPFSPKKIVKLLKKSERWPNKWSKVKTLEDKPRSGWPFFHKLCEKYYRKSCKYMRNNSTKQKGKKISTSHYRSKFRAQQYVESLEEKKAVHPSCKHGVRRICQLYTKRGPAGKLTWCEPPRDHLNYRRRDIQRSRPQNTGQATTVTTLRLKNVNLDTLWELVHSIPHRLENVRKHTGRHSGY